jgi:CHAT domain-containing protein
VSHSPDLEYSILWNQGNLFTHFGNYEKALNYLNKAYSLLTNSKSYDDQKVMRVLMDIGLVYELTKNYDEALNYYKKASQIGENPFLAKLYRNIGKIYFKQNNIDSARFYYQQAISNVMHYSEKSNYDLALCYLYLGEAYIKTDVDSSLMHLNRSLKILEELFGERNRDVAKVKIRIASIFMEKNEYEDAIILVKEAVTNLVPDANNFEQAFNSVFQSKIPDLNLPDAYNLLATCIYGINRGKLNNNHSLSYSVTLLEKSWELYGIIRDSYTEEESQIILNSNARTTIDLGIKISMELYRATSDPVYAEEAFRFSERGKSLVMLGALRGLEAEASTSLPPALLANEKKLKSDIRLYNNLLYEEARKRLPDQSKISLWNDKLFSTRKSYDSLVSTLSESYPEYHRLKYDFRVCNVSEVQEALASDQLLVSYHLSEAAVYGFLIGKNSFEAVELGSALTLLAKLDSLQDLYRNAEYFNPGAEDFRDLIRLNLSLHHFLIEPFRNITASDRLVVVPDGELGYLSFDQLVAGDNRTTEAGFAEINWLLKHFAISYSSSATIFVEYASPLRSGKNNGKVMAFAPSYDFWSARRNIRSDEDSILEKLSPIKWTQEEIESISGIYRTRKLQGDDATETAFKSDAGDYRILHLAMHTLIDNENPLNSKLVFTKPGEFNEDDGLLNTWELFNMNLSGDLAVLSACNTGTGKLERGEGIISLARGFFYAGVPSVVMTLWEIEDRSSVQLMTLFYEQLRGGLPKDRALQQAKLEYIRNAGQLKSHPYFWAGFVNIGNTDPLPSSDHNPLTFIIIMSSIAILITVLAILFINRRVYFRKKPL